MFSCVSVDFCRCVNLETNGDGRSIERRGEFIFFQLRAPRLRRVSRLTGRHSPRPVVRDRRSATGGSRKKQSQYNPSTFHHAPPTIPQIKTFATPMIPPSLNVVGKSTNPAPKYTAPCPEA